MKNSICNIALIPARAGSNMIKDKNIKLWDGHPLIAYTISAAINSDVFDSVIVSTDSKKYTDIAESYGAMVSLRPKEYAGDNSPDISWVTYVLNELSEKGQESDLFSILRPTSPFRMPETIKRALDEFLIEGIKTTIPFHRKLMDHPDYISGNYSTNFMESLSMSDE